jgi:hypothetical protein
MDKYICPGLLISLNVTETPSRLLIHPPTYEQTLLKETPSNPKLPLTSPIHYSNRIPIPSKPKPKPNPRKETIQTTQTQITSPLSQVPQTPSNKTPNHTHHTHHNNPPSQFDPTPPHRPRPGNNHKRGLPHAVRRKRDGGPGRRDPRRGDDWRWRVVGWRRR